MQRSNVALNSTLLPTNATLQKGLKYNFFNTHRFYSTPATPILQCISLVCSSRPKERKVKYTNLFTKKIHRHGNSVTTKHSVNSVQSTNESPYCWRNKREPVLLEKLLPLTTVIAVARTGRVEIMKKKVDCSPQPRPRKGFSSPNGK